MASADLLTQSPCFPTTRLLGSADPVRHLSTHSGVLWAPEYGQGWGFCMVLAFGRYFWSMVSSLLGITSLLWLLVWLWASSADSASPPGCASITCKVHDFLRLHARHSHCLGSPAPGCSNCSHLCVLLRHVGSPPCPLGAGPGSVGSICRSSSFPTTSHCPHICCHPFHLHNPPLLVWTSVSSGPGRRHDAGPSGHCAAFSTPYPRVPISRWGTEHSPHSY